MRSRITPAQDNAAHCHESAIRMLGHRWHGREELRRKLATKGYAREVVTATLETLEREKLLDERRFARSLAESKMRKGQGRHRVEQELMAVGLDPAIAREVLEELFDEDREAADLDRMVRKKMRSLSPSGATLDERKRNKLIAYLLNQGYEYAAVQAATRRIARESGELESNAHDE